MVTISMIFFGKLRHFQALKMQNHTFHFSKLFETLQEACMYINSSKTNKSQNQEPNQPSACAGESAGESCCGARLEQNEQLRIIRLFCTHKH